MFSEVGIPDLTQIATFVNSMVGRQVITPDAELERHLRQIARLPEATIDLTRPKTKVAPIMDSALVLRRIILAIKELPTYSTLSDEQLMAMVTPILEQMRLGIERETGTKIDMPTEGALGAPDSNPEEDQLSTDVKQIMQQLGL